MEDDGQDAKPQEHSRLAQLFSQQLHVIPHVLVREFVKNIKEDGSTMDGNCNAGSVLLKKKGLYKHFQVWLNE